MADVALILGPILFKDFEVPAGIAFGGAQATAVHNLLGGRRVIDTMGRNDATLQFSGVFSGSDATLRVRALNELRAAGLMLPLTWDVFFYTVILSDFTATYESSTWIPYKIVCTVVRDEASALIQDAISLAADVVADAASAGASAGLAGIDLSGSQTALGVAGATTRGSAAFSAAQGAVASDQASLTAGIASAQTGMDQAALAVPIGGSAAAMTSVSQINAAVNAAQSVSLLTTAQAYLGRVATNLSNGAT